MNVTIPKVTANEQATALNDTINTETFTSPKTDMFTSSPNRDEITAITKERDGNVTRVSLNKHRTF